MFRRLTLAGVMACGGVVIAQPWPAVPAENPAAETVYIMRTAGQNDRLVKVIRPADPTDPASLAEVKDSASGQTFVIPGKVLAKLPKAGSTRPEPATRADTSIPPTPRALPVPEASLEPVSRPPKAPPLPVESRPVTTAPEPPVAVRVEHAEAVSPLLSAARPPASAVLPSVTPHPTVPSPVARTAPLTPPQLLDPWRATGEAKAVAPTPPAAVAGPRLTPVATWRAAPQPTPPGVQDPWRPSGG